MEYEKFRLEVVQHIMENLHLEDLQRIMERLPLEEKPNILRFYADGYTAEDEKTAELIRDTNTKYHHPESDTLVGDFIILEIPMDKNNSFVCRFEVRYLYDEFTKLGWDSVDYIVKTNILQSLNVHTSVLNNLHNYEVVRDKLLICLRNIEEAKVRYRDKVSQAYGDMVMVLYVVMSDGKGHDRMISPVNREYFQFWGVDEDEVLAVALQNTAKLSPARLYYTIAEMTKDNTTAGDFMDPSKPLRKIPRSPHGVTLTASPQSDGAVSLFYPGVMERLAELADGDYYVVLTGKSESHIHPRGTVSLKMLRNALRASNREFPEDKLTDSIFLYDSKKKVLKRL